MSLRKLKVKQSLLLGTLLGLALTAPSLASAPVAQEPDAMTKQAIKFYSIGRLQEAIDTEAEAIKHNPSDWMSVATRSFFLWQQGNTIDAIADGEKAAALPGGNVNVLTNLAFMQQITGDQAAALKLFETACHDSPDDWRPRLGQARCYLASGSTEQGMELLAKMGSEEGKNFDWYNKLGEVYLGLEKLDLAEAAARKAAKAASTPEQKIAGNIQLCLALLRNNKVGEAQAFKKQILSDAQLRDPELIARTASQLIQSEDPSTAKKLLQVVQTNLKNKSDGDVFYRLGRIFEEKYVSLPPENSKSTDWSALAEKSYKQAILLAPDQYQFHIALAALSYGRSKLSTVIEELTRANDFDKDDTLLPVLLSSLKMQASEVNAKPLNLTEVRFSYNGAGCGCKLSQIAVALRNIEGVVFAASKGSSGGILANTSVTPVDEIFAKCSRAMPKPSKGQAEIKFEITSTKPVSNVREALKLAQGLSEPSAVSFFHELKAIEPVLPLEELASVGDSTKLSSRSTKP